MKKNKQPEDSFDNGENFPVDALGIPILVNVVESAEIPDLAQVPDNMVKNGEKETEPLKTKAAAEMESSSDSTAEIQLVQITEKITSLVTDEIMKALEPLIRNKVNLALQMYENELLQLPNDGGDTEAGIN